MRDKSEIRSAGERIVSEWLGLQGDVAHDDATVPGWLMIEARRPQSKLLVRAKSAETESEG